MNNTVIRPIDTEERHALDNSDDYRHVALVDAPTPIGTPLVALCGKRGYKTPPEDLPYCPTCVMKNGGPW